MGFRGLGFFILIIFIYICSFASSSSDLKNLPKDFLHSSKIEERGMYGRKIEGGGAGGGRGPGNGDNTNNDGSSSNTQTGAANNNHHHQNRHGGCNRNLNRIQFPTLLMITMISTLMQFFC